MEFVAAKIWSVAFQFGIAVMQDLPADDPPHVRPPTAVTGTVRIAFAVTGLMMNAVRAYPDDRSTFESKRRADCQKVLDPFWNFVTPMGQQAMVAHPNSKAQ